MAQIDLTEDEIETLIYALNLAAADLRESIADPQQSDEDKQEWSDYIAEIEEVSAKLAPLSEAA
jgi:hypothetical protein